MEEAPSSDSSSRAHASSAGWANAPPPSPAADADADDDGEDDEESAAHDDADDARAAELRSRRCVCRSRRSVASSACAGGGGLPAGTMACVSMHARRTARMTAASMEDRFWRLRLLLSPPLPPTPPADEAQVAHESSSWMAAKRSASEMAPPCRGISRIVPAATMASLAARRSPSGTQPSSRIPPSTNLESACSAMTLASLPAP